MQFATPQKLPDGRYLLKITGARYQVNGLELQDSLTSKSVNFKVTGDSVFSDVDKELLAQAKVSRVEWFGKELSDDTIANAYQESIEGGILGASLVTVKGKVTTLAFDSKKNPVDLADVSGTVDTLFELSGLWFLRHSFGPIWRVLQVRVRAPPKTTVVPKEYLFVDDVEDQIAEDDPADYLD